MIDEFSEKLFNELSEGLKAAELQHSQPKILLREQLLLIGDAVCRLQVFREGHPSDDLPAEVLFYKDCLPRFESLRIYYRERYALFRAMPFGSKKEKKAFYKLKLEYISSFFRGYGFYYDYWQSEAVELDELFYSAAADPNHVLQPVVPVSDFSYGTPMGFLVAKFMAFERLRDELLALLFAVEPAPVLSGTTVDSRGELLRPLVWTGEVIHLIELAHGIYLTGQGDTGKTGIVEFFGRLGAFFGVNLRVPKRGFDDLKARKTMSKTQFMDLMRAALLSKMDEDDAYDAQKRKGNRGRF